MSRPPAMDTLREEWTGLLRASRANSLFLTWEWASTWWKVYGAASHLHVLLVRARDGSLVGLAPLKRTGGTVAFIGTGSDVTPEHLDVIALPGWEGRVIRAVGAALLDDPVVHEIDLQPIDAEDSLTHLSTVFGSAPGILQKRRGPSCPYITLPESVDEFDRSRSRNYRKKIGEFQRRCERVLQARLRRSQTPSDVEVDMTRLRDLHQQRWAAGSRAFRSRQYVDFHAAFARIALDRDWLRLYALDSGDQAVAMLYCFLYGGRYSFYQSGRDPQFARERVGLVLMHHVIREAILDGAEVFDFLSGDEPYKYRWATGRSRATRVIYWKSFKASALSLWRARLNAMLDAQGRLLGTGVSYDWSR